MESPPKPAPIDPKAYYGYLFNEKKQPTLVMDALLRGIARYIIGDIGDKNDRHLTPTKLSAFYKAVGGNHDALFLEAPHPSISYIYASTGCSHSLQPGGDDFKAPSIPALTERGFVRWQSIELLLDPEEHVPFIQAAIRTFNLKHPDTGEPFPVDLPADALPKTADLAMVEWHNNCADKLWREATPDEDDPKFRPVLPPRPYIRSGHSHERDRSDSDRSHRSRQEERDYFNSRPIAASYRSKVGRDTNYRTHLSPHDGSVKDPRTRRRSVHDVSYSPSPQSSPVVQSNDVDRISRPTMAQNHQRSHSQPRHYRSSSSSSPPNAESNLQARRQIRGEDTGRETPKLVLDDGNSTINYKIPPSYPPANGNAPAHTAPHRHRGLTVPYSREKLAAYKIPIDLSGKLSSQFLRNGSVNHVPARATEENGPKIAADLTSDSDSKPQSNGVRWGANELNYFQRRNSSTTVDSDSDDTATNERERVKAKRLNIARPKAVQRRSGSHDGRYMIRESESRERDREERDSERRRHRRRAASPDDGDRQRYGQRSNGW